MHHENVMIIVPYLEFIMDISPVQFVSILEKLSISPADYQFIKI